MRRFATYFLVGFVTTAIWLFALSAERGRAAGAAPAAETAAI